MQNKSIVMMQTKPILMVEDNADDVALCLRSLKNAQVTNEIIIARDGAEALDQLFGEGPHTDRGPLNPAIMLLDLKLPKVNGLEVLEKMREDDRTCNIPVVVLTSSSEQEDVTKSYELKANSYVRKPVEFGEFSEAVKELGFYWLLLNEPLQDKG